ncbi:MAG: hypothetical protein AAB242_06955 [Nitrospirota bacterium]
MAQKSSPVHLLAYEHGPEIQILDIITTPTGCLLPWCTGRSYPIDWDRLDTKEKPLGWVHHLAYKQWMDTAKLKYFIEFVHAHFNWDITFS